MLYIGTGPANKQSPNIRAREFPGYAHARELSGEYARARASAREIAGLSPDGRVVRERAKKSALSSVPASALHADEIEQLGNVNEDRFIGKSQFIEGHFRPMATRAAPGLAI